jgi:putative peptidoglycan lipid II flippase
MAPALFGVSVSQINLLLDTVIASFLPTGSVSWLYYSDRLVELPLGVFAIAVATVIMPNLSRQHAAQTPEAFSRTLDWALRMIILLALPATLALVLLAEPILLTLFQYGETSLRDMQMAGLSLQAYALGLLAFMLIKVLAPAFFAREDTKTPMWYAGANALVNVVFSIALFPFFGHVGIAVATSIAGWVNAGLLAGHLWRDGVLVPDPRLKRRTALALHASAWMVAALLLLDWILEPVAAGPRGAVVVLVVLVGAGVAVYGAVAVATGVMTRSELAGALRRRPGGTGPAAT